MITSSGRDSSEKYFGPRANVESKHSSSIRKEQKQEGKEKKSTLDQWALLVSSSSINDFNFLRSTMATINARLRFLFQRGLPSFYDVQRFLESPRKSFPRSMINSRNEIVGFKEFFGFLLFSFSFYFFAFAKVEFPREEM